MKRTTMLSAMTIMLATVASQPANAYDLRVTGQTMASQRLVADVLTAIGSYSSATGGCRFIFSVDMRVVPGSVTPASHAEIWTVNACAAKQRFRIAMRNAPDGGTDYAIRPLTGRMPLHAM